MGTFKDFSNFDSYSSAIFDAFSNSNDQIHNTIDIFLIPTINANSASGHEVGGCLQMKIYWVHKGLTPLQLPSSVVGVAFT